MNNSESQQKVEKEVLRIALDKEAMDAYHSMVQTLRAKNEYLKIQPSAFASFLVADYFKVHFESDIDLLTAQFFDSQSYYQAQMKSAKNTSTFEETMSETLAFIKRIKAKAIRKSAGLKKIKSLNAPTQN